MALAELFSPMATAMRFTVGPVWQWYSKPRLKVTASPIDPFIKHTETALPGMNAMQAIDRKWLNYYRLKVTNSGRKQAQACRLLIINVQYVEHGVWRDVAGWEPVTLKWALIGQPSVDISPKEERYCDLGHVPSNYIQNNVYRQDQPRRLNRQDPDHHAMFFLECAAQPRHQYGALGFGDYCIRLRLVTGNTGSLDFAVYLKFMGRFASMLPEVPEGTIFEVPKRPPETGTVFAPRQ